jgi:hypothetical protein
MSRFSGPQGRGAGRRAREQRREEAIERQKEYDKKHGTPVEKIEALVIHEVTEVVDEAKKVIKKVRGRKGKDKRGK